MTDEQKIRLVDNLLSDLAAADISSQIPVIVGTLNTPQGIKGMVVAEIGHPVFEHKDRYVIYLDSETPEKISKYGEPVMYSLFKVKIPYYKETLVPFINFSHNNQ